MEIQYRNSKFSDLITHTAWGISIDLWMFLLWKNKFRVGWRNIPKVFLITGNAILNTPLQIIEHYRFRTAIKKTKVRNPVFIIGHYRSGTTYLHYLMSKDPNFAWCSTYQGLTPNTFLTFGRISKAVLRWAMPDTRPQDNMKSGPTLPLEEEFAMANMSRASLVHGYYFPSSITESFDAYVIFKDQTLKKINYWKRSFMRLVRKLVFSSGGRQLILKSPANTGRVRELMELFPNARFIHIHRNPYDVYLSTVNLYEKILPLLGLHRADNAQMEEFVFYGYEQLCKKFLSDRWLIHPDRLIEVSYDQLVGSPLETLRQIYDQFGFDNFESVCALFEAEVNTAKGFTRNNYKPIPDDVKERIKARWGFAFDAFGYPR